MYNFKSGSIGYDVCFQLTNIIGDTTASRRVMAEAYGRDAMRDTNGTDGDVRRHAGFARRGERWAGAVCAAGRAGVWEEPARLGAGTRGVRLSGPATTVRPM